MAVPREATSASFSAFWCSCSSSNVVTTSSVLLSRAHGVVSWNRHYDGPGDEARLGDQSV